MIRTRVVSVLVLAAGLCLFVPWTPIIETSFYEYAIHLAAVARWQFGTALIATYGPLGFVTLAVFEPSTYPILILANVLLYIASVVCLRALWRALHGPERPPPALWIAAVLVLPAFGPVRFWAASVFLPYWLVNAFVLHHLSARDGRPWPSHWLAVAVLAAFVLVKTPFVALVPFAVALVALDEAFALRRVPWTGVAFLAAVIVWFGLAGQRLSHLPAFVAGSVMLMTAHKAGMDLSTPGSAVCAVLFASAALVFWAAAAWTAAVRFGARSIAFAATLAASLYLLFQYAFIRADAIYIVSAGLTFGSIALVAVPLCWSPDTGRIRLGALVRAAVLAPAAMMIAIWGVGIGRPISAVLRQAPAGMWRLITRGTADLQRAQNDRLRALRDGDPLPPLPHSIDSSAIDFGLAQVYGRTLRVLPTVSAYNATSPALTARNRDYFVDPHGPAAVLIGASPSIDGRYPSVTDPQSLLALRSHFELIGRTARALVLRRRERPLATRLVGLGARDARLGETVVVPATAASIVWVQIAMAATRAGGLRNLLYKVPSPQITVAAGARQLSYRLTVATAENGMILSPLLDDLQAGAAFYAAAPIEASHVVSSLAVSAPECPWCVEDRVHLTFFNVAFDR